MKVGILGAGITGLVSAYEAGKENIDVTVLESENKTGGIAGTFEFEEYTLEKYYHHFFKSDIYLRKLFEELGMDDKLLWHHSNMGFFLEGKLYDFGTPSSLIKFTPLSILGRTRFGTATFELLCKNNCRDFENITAAEWIKYHAGEEAYKKIWKPLLITKFGDRYESISMAWLWGKIKLRGTSRENGKEVLGYIDGSTGSLLTRIEEKISDQGNKIILNCHVNSIECVKSFQVNTDCGQFSFDSIICTFPMPELLKIAGSILPTDYFAREEKIKYTAVVCMVLVLDRQFTRYYWLNIGDEKIPFGGLIEHTNLVGCKKYGGNHILYISNYLYKDSSYYRMDEDELLDQYTPYLKSINPLFEKGWVKNKFLFKDEYAQPIIKTGYCDIEPGFVTPVAGLFISNMCCIYPEDRGMNYAVRDGIEVTKMLFGG